MTPDCEICRLPKFSIVIAAGVREAPERGPDRFEMADAGPDDPAPPISASGMTGLSEGAPHGPRALPGRLPGVAVRQESFPQSGDLFRMPTDRRARCCRPGPRACWRSPRV